MINENKWGILYCPKNGFGSRKYWEKIQKCLCEFEIDFDFVQSENSGSVERLVNMLISNGYKTIVRYPKKPQYLCLVHLLKRPIR